MPTNVPSLRLLLLVSRRRAAGRAAAGRARGCDSSPAVTLGLAAGLVAALLLGVAGAGRGLVADSADRGAGDGRRATCPASTPRRRPSLAERARRLEAVQDVTNEIVRELDLTALLETIIARAAQLVGAASGTIALWDAEAEELVARALYRTDPWIMTQPLKLGQATAGLAAQRREAVIVNDYRSWPHANPEALRRTRGHRRPGRADPLPG